VAEGVRGQCARKIFIFNLRGRNISSELEEIR